MKTARPHGSNTKITKARRPQKSFVIFVIFVIFVVSAWAVYRSRASHSPADGPIILISIDTLRADHLPAYGYTKVRTPNIDALAAAGTVFEHAYSHAPQTLPAHTTILTGQLPFEHGVRDNVGFTVKPGQWFIQRALQERGWRDRRIRVGLRAAIGGRLEPGLRHLRQRAAAGLRRALDRPGPARRRQHARGRGEVARGARCDEAVLPLLPHLRAAQAVRAAAALRRLRAVRRRDRLLADEIDRPAARPAARLGRLRARDDRAARRSRRRARRPRRTGARAVSLQLDDRTSR